jgi:hypothetical protein
MSTLVPQVATTAESPPVTARLQHCKHWGTWYFTIYYRKHKQEGWHYAYKYFHCPEHEYNLSVPNAKRHTGLLWFNPITFLVGNNWIILFT